jgi:PmbA protein
MNTEEALKLAERSGAEEAEVYHVKTRSITIDIKTDTIELARQSLSEGIGIRVIVNGAVGYASTNNPQRIADAAKIAYKTAKIRPADPKWKELPSNAKYPAVERLYDEKIENIEVETCIEHALEIIKGATSIDATAPASGRFTCAVTTQQILNTNQVNIIEHHTTTDGYIETVARDRGQTATGYDFEVSRHIDEIDFYEIGRRAAALAKQSLDPITVPPQTTTVLLQPMAIADLISHTLIPSLSAENVQKNRSSLKDKINTQIASEKLNIIDDGLLPGGLRSSASDDEGTPSKTTQVIRQGVLQTYLYDKYTADQHNTESTANAIRYSYNQTPVISTRNFIIEHPASDIIAETTEGIIIHNIIGAHTANHITGDFSVEARNAFTIKKGEISKPIKTLMLTGNIFELLKNVSGAGSDVKNLGNIITPTIRIEETKIVG